MILYFAVRAPNGPGYLSESNLKSAQTSESHIAVAQNVSTCFEFK